MALIAFDKELHAFMLYPERNNICAYIRVLMFRALLLLLLPFSQWLVNDKGTRMNPLQSQSRLVFVLTSQLSFDEPAD